MRILNVNISLDPEEGGGTAERTFQVSRFLARAGAECAVLTTTVGLTPERRERLAGVRVVALRCLWKRFMVPAGPSGAVARAVASADIVHLSNHWNVLNALAYVAARRLGKPYVVCPAGALPIYGRSRRLKNLYNLAVGRAILRNARAWVAITPAEVLHFGPYGVDPARVAVIPNGVDVAEYAARDEDAATFRRRHGLGERPFILFMGRLNRIKGPDLLLEAFLALQAEFPRLHLVFAGPDGGLRAALERTARGRPGGERVRFTGYLGPADRAAAYRAAQLVAVPSRQEAMSIVVLEAAASGRPVLLTDACGFPEVERVEGGRLAPASAHALAATLLDLLRDPVALEVMGRNLRLHALSFYSWERAVERYLGLYRRLLSPAVGQGGCFLS